MKTHNSELKTQNYNSNLKVRINKFLARSEFGSRRSVENIIKIGKVKINNKIAILSDKVDANRDIVEVDGKTIKPKTEFVYYAVNKPVGYTSSVRDVYAEKLVTDLVPKEPKVYPIGRLDKDSRGLIILTNDGDLTNNLTHPKFEHEKEYEVKIKFQIPRTKLQTNSKFQIPNFKTTIQKLKTGVKLSEGIAKADKIDIMDIDEINNDAVIRIILHQGWKRQIRRMCEKIGLIVFDLKRIRIGKLKLDNLEDGKYRVVKKENII